MDGSLTYGKAKREISNNQVIISARKSIQRDLYLLQKFEQIEAELFEEFQKFCQDLLEENIELSFFLSPYHPLVYQKIKKDYTLVLDVEKKIIEFAIDKNIKLIGSYSPLKANATIKDFSDAMHLRKASMKIFNFN